jgi:hypothetical protein
VIDAAEFAELLDQSHEPPCVSIYLPTHRSFPQDRQNAIDFRNLLREVEQSLAGAAYDEPAIDELMAPLRDLALDEDFWTHATDGLAVFASPGYFRMVQLQRTPPRLAIAADRFHVKPLLRIVQSADRYQVLALNRREIRLFEGNRDALDEIDLAPEVPQTIVDALGEELTEKQLLAHSYGSGPAGGAGGGRSYNGSKTAGIRHGHSARADEIDVDIERFFRAVSHAVQEHHSKPSGLPLILAAAPEYHAQFRSVSRNPSLLQRAIEADPGALSIDELRARAWEAMEPDYLARLAALVDRFGAAQGAGTATDDLSTAGGAVLQGRVDTLLVDAERQIPGRIDTATGEVQPADLSDAQVNDALDDLAQQVLQTGGQVVVVPAERMPTTTGLAAIYRY